MKLSGWGRYPAVETRLAAPRDPEALQTLVRDEPSRLIARGNGRAYGDAALGGGLTVSTRNLDRMLAFDPATGCLTAQAGVLLSDLLAVFVPRGWFPPVTPGTRHVTLGGMIAADVHGKNHHRDGSFGRHVDRLSLLTADGSILDCSRDRHPALFAATLGGMGLTGIILDASFRLAPIETAWVRQEILAAPDLAGIMALFEDSAAWTYSVAWIDCQARGRSLGRSLLFRGEHARRDELPPDVAVAPLRVPRRPVLSVPVDLPSWTLNPLSVRAFNELYYQRGRAGGGRAAIRAYDSFFYPLDTLLAWNRIYGGNGFVQYQCVLPKPASAAGLDRLLDRITDAGTGSFLAVLKLFGPQDGVLSFPLEGYTLALDFPATPQTFSLLVELDGIVADHGGRLYLAKDACTAAARVRRAYPRHAQFRDLRRETGADQRFQSLLSERLDL